METQKLQTECVLCGRQLKGRGSKSYWPAHRIREVKPEYKGKLLMNQNLGVPYEKGAYVCRSQNLCLKRRQK